MNPWVWPGDPGLGSVVCQLTPDLLASGSSLFILKVRILHQVLDKSAASIAIIGPFCCDRAKNRYFFFFFNFLKFIYGCVGSSFLCEGFLQLWQAGATLHRGARASHCCSLSCCGAQAPDAQAQ